MPRSVEVSILIRSTPGKVLEAFLQPHVLGGWWGVERSLIEPRTGGVYTLVWGVSKAGFKYISSGIIAAYDPSKCLHIDNLVYCNPDHPPLGPMKLNMDVTIEDDGVRLSLVQDGYQSGPDWDWYYAAVREAWPNVLQRLKHELER